jgi:sporulation protein YlmC with PRC-barrel domain
MQARSSPAPQMIGTSALIGDPVVDRTGAALGRIREIMLDVARGRIAYAVLAFEDPAEPGESDGAVRKLFALPWEALRLDAQSRQLVLDTDRERLRNAPGFDPEHWPSMAQPTWTSALYEFYGVEPYHSD